MGRCEILPSFSRRGGTRRVTGWFEFLSLLLHIPQKNHRRDDHAGQTRAVGRGDYKVRRGNKGQEFESLNLHCVGGCFCRGSVGSVEPRVAQLLELLVGRPTEPCIFTGGAERSTGRRDELRAGGIRVKDRPTALFDRFLRRAAS